MKSIYKSTIVKGNIKKSMEKYARLHNLLYNFGKVLPEFPSDNQLLVIFKDFEPDFKNWYYIAFGWLESFIELCLGKKTSHEIKKKSWNNEDSTQCLFS